MRLNSAQYPKSYTQSVSQWLSEVQRYFLRAPHSTYPQTNAPNNTTMVHLTNNLFRICFRKHTVLCLQLPQPRSLLKSYKGAENDGQLIIYLWLHSNRLCLFSIGTITVNDCAKNVGQFRFHCGGWSTAHLSLSTSYAVRKYFGALYKIVEARALRQQQMNLFPSTATNWLISLTHALTHSPNILTRYHNTQRVCQWE